MNSQDFFLELYNEAEKEIKEVYKEQKKNRDDLLQKLAIIMLTYDILGGLMNLSVAERNKEYNKLSKLIKKSIKNEAKLQEDVINNILSDTVNKSFKFWNYNINYKDVRKIIESNFKGKHFSTRVWENETEVVKKLHYQIKDFLDGKVNVNQIKKEIEKTFNNGAYNTKRLVETEVSRCSSNAFDRFCKETGVKRIKRNAILDTHTCSDCADYDGVIYDLDKAPSLPSHPFVVASMRLWNKISHRSVYKCYLFCSFNNNSIALSSNFDIGTPLSFDKAFNFS